MHQKLYTWHSNIDSGLGYWDNLESHPHKQQKQNLNLHLPDPIGHANSPLCSSKLWGSSVSPGIVSQFLWTAELAGDICQIQILGSYSQTILLSDQIVDLRFYLYLRSTPWWIWWSSKFEDHYLNYPTQKLISIPEHPLAYLDDLLWVFFNHNFIKTCLNLVRVNPPNCIHVLPAMEQLLSSTHLSSSPSSCGCPVVVALLGLAFHSVLLVVLKRSACRRGIVLIFFGTAPFLCLWSFHLPFFRPFLAPFPHF